MVSSYTIIFVLMMLTTEVGWIIMPLQGNPFYIRKQCEGVRDAILNSSLRHFGGFYFYDLECDKRKVIQIHDRHNPIH